jgi:8-oxo-dGTP diphosphatase
VQDADGPGGVRMDVVKTWSGGQACALQGALRMTNEVFAGQLGVAVRTVAAWHAEPDMMPRLEMQHALDTLFERASEPVRSRFALLAETAGDVQALRVAIAVVVRDGQVLLVCRRGEEAGGISWQFPAGMIKPGVRPEAVAVRETLAETGVHIAVQEPLGQRLHPVTGVVCVYFRCTYLAGTAANADALENVDVMWVDLAEVTRFIPAQQIFPPILTALEAV